MRKQNNGGFFTLKQSALQEIRQDRTKYAEMILLFGASAWSCFSLLYYLADLQVYAPLGLLFSPFLFSFYRLQWCSRRTLCLGTRLLCLFLSFFSACALYLSADLTQRFFSTFSSFLSFSLRAFCVGGVTVLLYALFTAFCLFCQHDTGARFDQPLRRKWFFVLWGVFFMTWFVLYLTCFYPGLFSPDTAGQLYIVEGTAVWSNHHPVLHTLLLYITFRLSGYKPIYYILLQMLAMTALFAYLCYWLRKRVIFKWLWYGILLYLLLHPVFSINSFSFIKDTLFSGAVLFLTICVADLVLEEANGLSFGRLLRLAVAALLVLFLRNNGLIVVMLTFFALVLFARKQRLRAFCVGGGTIAVFCVMQFVVFPKVGIVQTSLVESLGIPLQQMCSVIAQGKSYSEDVMQYLSSLLPLQTIAEAFDPNCIDPIKFHEQFSSAPIQTDFPLFLRMWVRGLLQHPLEYVEAYLHITRFLWDPMQKAGMIESFYVSPHFTFFAPKPLISALSALFMKAVNLMQNSRYAFLTRPFWNTAVHYTVIALLAAAVLPKKRAKRMLVWIPAFAVWASLMLATPIGSCGRYALSVFLCIPLLAALALEPVPQQKSKEFVLSDSAV